MSSRRILIAALLCAAPAAAQIGFPFPSQRSPFPGRQPQTTQPSPGGSRRGKKTQVEQKQERETVAADGVITEIKPASWTIQADDTRYLTVKITASTKFRRDGAEIAPDSLKLGDRIHVESIADEEQDLTATLITALKPAPKPEEPVESLEITTSAPGAATERSSPRDSDDPGRPRLTRGIPPPRKAAPEEQPPAAPAEKASVKAPTPSDAPAEMQLGRTPAQPLAGDPLLQKAKAVALAFTSTLPNFEVQQITTRYQSNESGRNWTAQDTVTADVTYRGGKEDYKNIRINNKLVNKDMMDIPGARSTGEFGTTLVSLFAPASRTEFRKLKDTSIANRPAVSYSYVVQRPNSDYRIFFGSQWILPGYSGRVWIDKESSRVLRIEIQADNIPADFPLDKVEAVIDYGPERLGSEQYILPIDAENLSCLRGTRLCGRNALSFRNYRLYKSEAVITFDAK